MVCRVLGVTGSSAAKGGGADDGEGGLRHVRAATTESTLSSPRDARRKGWGAWWARQPWFLIVTTAGAPLLANYSLLLNSVGVYQLSKVRSLAADHFVLRSLAARLM